MNNFKLPKQILKMELKNRHIFTLLIFVLLSSSVLSQSDDYQYAKGTTSITWTPSSSCDGRPLILDINWKLFFAAYPSYNVSVKARCTGNYIYLNGEKITFSSEDSDLLAKISPPIFGNNLSSKISAVINSSRQNFSVGGGHILSIEGHSNKEVTEILKRGARLSEFKLSECPGFSLDDIASKLKKRNGSRTSAKQLSSAKLAFQQFDYDKAEKECLEVLNTDSNNQDAKMLLAEIRSIKQYQKDVQEAERLTQAGDLDAAKKIYQEILRKNPNSPVSRQLDEIEREQQTQATNNQTSGTSSQGQSNNSYSASASTSPNYKDNSNNFKSPPTYVAPSIDYAEQNKQKQEMMRHYEVRQKEIYQEATDQIANIIVGYSQHIAAEAEKTRISEKKAKEEKRLYEEAKEELKEQYQPSFNSIKNNSEKLDEWKKSDRMYCEGDVTYYREWNNFYKEAKELLDDWLKYDRTVIREKITGDNFHSNSDRPTKRTIPTPSSVRCDPSKFTHSDFYESAKYNQYKNDKFAIELIEQALYLESKNIDYNYLYSALLTKSLNVNSTKQLLRHKDVLEYILSRKPNDQGIVTQLNDANFYLVIAPLAETLKAAFKNKEYDAALRYAADIQKENNWERAYPKDYLFLDIAKCYYGKGQYEVAINKFQEYENLGGTFPLYISSFYKTYCYKNLKDFTNARLYAQKALEMIKGRPSNYMDFINLTTAYYDSKGDITTTKEYYKYLLENTPEKFDFYEDMALKAGNKLRELEIKANANSKFPIDTFKDSRDGQIYKTVKIGSQIWMAENLRYKSGENVKSRSEWRNLKDNSEAYCYFNNDVKNIQKYGMLYTFNAAEKACPSGWHLPNTYEWEYLEKYLKKSGFKNPAKALASASGWKESTKRKSVGNNQQLNNATGFSAFPSGERRNSAYSFDKHTDFEDFDDFVNFWKSKRSANGGGLMIYLNSYSSKIEHFDANLNSGQSVRCVKNYNK
jgi:uncharacterized protein (TIGR02145 family)